MFYFQSETLFPITNRKCQLKRPIHFTSDILEWEDEFNLPNQNAGTFPITSEYKNEIEL